MEAWLACVDVNESCQHTGKSMHCKVSVSVASQVQPYALADEM